MIDNYISMFDTKKEENNPVEKNQQNNQEKPIDVNKSDKFLVRSMPEKFLVTGNLKAGKQINKKSTPAKLGGMKKNILIGGIVAVVVLGLLGLGFWMLMQSIESPEQESLINNQNQNRDINNDQQIDIGPPIPEAELLLCGPENCTECDIQECTELSTYCHLEKVSCSSQDIDCDAIQCLAGAEQEKIEANQEDPIYYELAQDTDYDLLSDIEEGLWGTDPLNTDTDGDTYSDGIEIKNLFNPNTAGDGTGKLIDSGLIKEHVDSNLGYAIYYPANWQTSVIDPEQIMFISNTGEFIQVIVENNENNYLSATEWYLLQNPEVEEQDLEEILIGNWSGVRSPDGLNVYLLNSEKIYIISYNIGLKTELNYQTTFEMMLKSFRVFDAL